jgi:cytochrome P450
MEMTLIAALLLQRFTITPAADQHEPALAVGLSLRPAGGMRLVLAPRLRSIR